MRSLLVVSFLTVVCLIAKAQYTLHGSLICADDNEPLLGAHIHLLSDWQVSTVTDLEGRFELAVPSKDGDSLLITFIGYEDKVVAINDLGLESVVKMLPRAQEMESVVVTAERLIAEEFSSHKINRLEIYKNPSSKADPILAVNSLPSTTTADESANISFRGSGPGETGVFLNGVPLYDFVRFSQLDGIGTLSVFNTELLSNVQVFPGNPPLEFGNVSSGLIAIETDNSIAQASQTSLVLSPASFGASHRTPVGQNQSLFTYVNYQPSAIFKALNQESLQDIAAFNSVDGGVHYFNQITDDWQLKVFNYTQAEGYDFNYQSPTYSGLFEQRKTRNLTIANLTHQGRYAQWRFNGGANFSDLGFNYSNTDIDITSRDYFVSVTHQFEMGSWGMKSGISYDDRQSDFTGVVPDFSFAERLTDPFSLINSINQRRIAESFFYLKYDFSERLVAGAAFRRSLRFLNENRYWSRQINLSYELNDFWRVNVGYGTFHSQPLAQGEVEQQPLVQNDQASIDVFYKRRRTDFTISVFQKWVDREDQQEEIQGLEMAHGHAFGKFRYNLSYTFINAKVEDGDIEYAGNFDFDYFVKAGLEWTFLPNWTAGSRVLLRQGTLFRPVVSATFQPELNAFEPEFSTMVERDRLPPYNIVDINLSRLIPISENLTIVSFLSVGNVFDFRNTRSFAYSFDYQTSTEQFFARRVVYFGAVLNFL